MTDIFEKLPDFCGHFVNDYYCRENCFMRLYDKVNEEAYDDYLEELKKKGFRLLQEREINQNRFAALTNEISVTLLYTPCDNTLRITASEKYNFPPFEKSEYERKCKSGFYAFENDQTLIDCGMCLLIQCSDYSFFVVDSGHYFQFNDNDRIYKFMRERTPKEQKVVICGWFITHAHSDHISKLIDFLKYNTDDVIIEGFYQNLLPSDYPNDEWNHEEKELAEKLFKAIEAFDAPVYKLHTGERFYIRNITFDVLGTFEDIFPEYIDDYNDSSCILMAEVEKTRIFIPGDASIKADKMLKTRFGDSLKCDIVQIAHHGHTGLSTECYKMLYGDIAVFPVTRIFFDSEYERHEANRTAVEIADRHFVTGDGTVCVPLPYAKGNVYTLPDETFEDFEKIKRLWRYVYTDERKAELYDLFISNGGDPDNMTIPSSPFGYIEPKPPIEE